MKVKSNIKGFNNLLIVIISLIYLFSTFVVLLSQKSYGFLNFYNFSWIECVSLLIFICSIFIGIRNSKFYTFFLVFNIIALPASLDNIFPSVLLSSHTDFNNVYFPIITHIDIFIACGIYKFSIEKNSYSFKNKFDQIAFGLVLALIFISILANILKSNSYYDFGLILSHSYHLRYFILFYLLFSKTSISKNHKEIFFAILVAIIFLLFESFLFSYVFHSKNRLTSGTIGNNVFANILTAITCYYTYLIFRKIINIRYFIIVVIMMIAIIFTKTRSAILVFSLYLFVESVIYGFYLIKLKAIKKILALLFFFTITTSSILYISLQNERLSIDNFKVEKIDLSNKNLKDIIVLENNKFNESLILRLEHYQTSLNMIYSDPFFGIGTGRWNRYKGQFGSKERHVMDSHNDLLAMMSQYGIISGLFLSLYMYLVPFLKKKVIGFEKMKYEKALRYLYIINFVMIFCGLTNANLFKHQVFGFLLLIVMLYLFREKSFDDRNNKICTDQK